MGAPRAALWLSAGELAEALYSGWDGSHRIPGYDQADPVAVMSLGPYEGTSIPRRKVPASAPVSVVDRGVVEVEDAEGGWIADRFGPVLGRREYIRAEAWLRAKADGWKSPSAGTLK